MDIWNQTTPSFLTQNFSFLLQHCSCLRGNLSVFQGRRASRGCWGSQGSPIWNQVAVRKDREEKYVCGKPAVFQALSPLIAPSHRRLPARWSLIRLLNSCCSHSRDCAWNGTFFTLRLISPVICLFTSFAYFSTCFSCFSPTDVFIPFFIICIIFCWFYMLQISYSSVSLVFLLCLWYTSIFWKVFKFWFFIFRSLIPQEFYVNNLWSRDQIVYRLCPNTACWVVWPLPSEFQGHRGCVLVPHTRGAVRRSVLFL